ncbi:response regulator, partial [Enterococcus faecalis]|uniref:response regulator n=1 Tax=Enterococcus faecalis TaxID=1351 RepID=UPI003CC54600
TRSFDFVLLDSGLPDIDGIDLLKILRKRMHLPNIIISARNNEEEKVKALDLGADDYETKPFGTNELLARIRTALRHQN